MTSKREYDNVSLARTVLAYALFFAFAMALLEWAMDAKLFGLLGVAVTTLLWVLFETRKS